MPTITLQDYERSQAVIETLADWPLPTAPATDLAAHTSARPTRDGTLGAVLGAAIGDALGHPTEFLRSLAAIHSKYGPAGVTNYELYWEKGGQRFAPYTDDTQLAEAVLRTLLWSRATQATLERTMTEMGKRFVAWAYAPQGGHRAPGNATLAGCRALLYDSPWREAGHPDAGGCGSVMRAYPFGIVYADDIEKAEYWAVEHSHLTHGAPIALAACAAMAVATARTLQGAAVDAVLQEMVAAARRYDEGTADMIAQAIQDARDGIGPEVTLSRLEGWAAHEAIAAAAYLVALHPADFRSAALAGANTPGDSDSIATLAGALVGARVGLSGISADWVRDIERSTELCAVAEAGAILIDAR